jgi:hypothetical protein
MRPGPSLAVFLALCAAAVLASTTLAATPYDARPRCDGLHLRTGPSTSYSTRVTIDHATRVTVAAEVSGSAWSTTCGGSAYSGSKWAKVVAIDGVPTTQGYGVKALYAALGLLVTVAPASTPTAPPATATPTAAPPTTIPSIAPSAGPTASLEPSTSPPTPPSASPQRSGSPAATGSPAAPGSTSTFGSPGELIVLVLALISVFLAGVAVGDHWRRDGSIKKVPSSRLDDVLH